MIISVYSRYAGNTKFSYAELSNAFMKKGHRVKLILLSTLYTFYEYFDIFEFDN